MTGADGCALLATGPRAMAEAAGPDMGLEADDPAMAAKLQVDQPSTRPSFCCTLPLSVSQAHQQR